MNQKSLSKVEQLINKGVKIPNPDTIEIGESVSLDRISGKGTVIHSGSKIFGSSTLILDNVKIGYENPVTVSNCYLGPGAKLKGGFFHQAVFLKNTSAGSGAQVREGTIVEEEASIAHTVGLKQTILFPFVTLGSLINFCDCLMSGGTEKKDHSEVGSSFIHFNYTPNQDKATPSLLGDVPHGVMLNRKPVFLGGQGGLVGPCRLTFGTVTAAGTICRKDELREGRLIFGGLEKSGNIPYSAASYKIIKRPVLNNIIYIANLIALMRWYDNVRSLFITDNFPLDLLQGMKATLSLGISERIKRLREFSEKIPDLNAKWPEVEKQFHELENTRGDERLMDNFIKSLEYHIDTSDKDYIKTIKSIPDDEKESGTAWLQSIVDQILEEIQWWEGK
ncbi:MAG: protein GlmU [Deltaproteobacteria bacterium]|nr:protein GlmU [Deltaproteobacteria bacterium]MBW2217912.1 protein GlmU [Deltaproteobacteria bacterium]